MPENVAVRVLNRPHSITADVEIPDGGAEGVLLCHGGNSGGYTFFVKDRRLHYVHNYVGIEELRVDSGEELAPGRRQLRYEFQPTGAPDLARGKGTPGRAQLFVDGRLVGQAEFPVTVPLMVGISEGLLCGRDEGSPISAQYRPPFAFTGRIHKVVVDVSGEQLRDMDAESRTAMARQ